jgi:hypothetical protein
MLACSVSAFCHTCFTLAICEFSLLLASLDFVSLLTPIVLGLLAARPTIDLKLIWLGGLFNLFGGGDLLTGVIYSVVITDITPREQL